MRATASQATAEALKEVIREIHAGADPEATRRKFKAVLARVSPEDIGRAEEELVREGLPREEVRRLCDVHLEVLGEALGRNQPDVPPGHPVHTFRQEHDRIIEFLEDLGRVVSELQASAEDQEVWQEKLPVLKHLVDHLMEVENHNLREENVLFPYLEKHGITEPPNVMWAEHDDLRRLKKQLKEAVEEYGQTRPAELASRLAAVAESLRQQLSGHIFKENNVLYPMALRVLSPQEWQEIRRQCDQIGYCCFTPEPAPAQVEPAGEGRTVAEADGRLTFPTGSLTRQELLGLLNTLPVDITFVDKNDVFRYYNDTKERIFVRTPASLGRKVQQCHPQKSVDRVNQIIDDFRNGRRDAAHFWLHVGEKYAYISYYAVRDERGEYLGALETIQDIQPFKAIEGEKRLDG
ncbi:MAG: DUF438 domain-containing protein [Clostridia bacterium]|nr:MAG: DUF438 domain-containing protein [Clostridia bacterium]